MSAHLYKPSEAASRLVASGTTPATAFESSHPACEPDCACVWVMRSLSTWALKFWSPRCGVHSALAVVPWSSRDKRYWAIGHAS